MEWNIIGHQKQIQFLTDSLMSGKTAHAYIFAGPQFVGKKSLAVSFAKKILQIDGMNPQSFDLAHPDFLEIKGLEGIKIEEVRQLIYKLSLKPYQANYKFALIDNAEHMTVEAQNALLKNLEEPRPNTVICLVTANPEKLLRTIASRAQKITFGPVPTADYAQLIANVTDEEVKTLIFTQAAGRPGLAVRIASDKMLVDKLQQINDDFLIVQSQDLPDKLRLAYDLAELDTVDLKQVLDCWLIKLQNELLVNATAEVAENLRYVDHSRRYLDQNVNSKLLLTNLMLRLK